MAKKTGFKMAAELRGLIKSNKKMTCNEAYNALKEIFPIKKSTRAVSSLSLGIVAIFLSGRASVS